MKRRRNPLECPICEEIVNSSEDGKWVICSCCAYKFKYKDNGLKDDWGNHLTDRRTI